MNDLKLNDLFRTEGLDPNDIAILLHTPKEPKLARALPWLAVTAPDVFNTYQSTHNAPATATLRKLPYMASFVRVESGALAFVAVYARHATYDRSMRDIGAMPGTRHLIDHFGACLEFDTPPPGATWLWFDFDRTDHLNAYTGRLQIRPTLTQSYARLAQNLDADIVALSEESILSPAAPDWRDFIVTGPEVRALPPSWQARLREWRGIYLIVDETAGARYVGAAYGEENILGRWQAHVASDRGVTKHLGQRDPHKFRFAILERVSPDMPTDDVIALEHTWMNRLHTHNFGLNA